MVGSLLLRKSGAGEAVGGAAAVMAVSLDNAEQF